MAAIKKFFSKKPLIKIKKLGADQVVALIVIAFGMLGFVTTYIIVADKISAYIDSLPITASFGSKITIFGPNSKFSRPEY